MYTLVQWVSLMTGWDTTMNVIMIEETMSDKARMKPKRWRGMRGKRSIKEVQCDQESGYQRERRGPAFGLSGARAIVQE
ncbi:hypothetical protein PM082_009449 [Marasmius tenuissimus]|nr:hypothetical protein PM082_009449 [Marasmius tenuissimus]